MKILKTPISLILILLVVASCQKDNEQVFEEQQIDTDVPEQVTLEITDDVINTLKTNFYNVSDVQVIDFLLPDGTTEQRFQVENDITFSASEIDHLATLEGTTARNYYTNNLVSPRTLTIIGFTGGSQALSSKERTALQYAVNNFNRLNLTIRFTLTFGTDYQNKDMVVYRNPNNSGSGGSAGFPSNGNPNKFIQIYGLSGSTTDVNEHVITHEMGHSVGFRHTDYFSRQSCGQNTNEGTAGVGANPIPGTPAGFDPTSIMLACFSNNEDGEFNNNDVTSLRFLY